jgi:asparagine synthase (glutamine-hydrolysing)
MSGLCGWFSREPGAVPIAQMAAPLCRLDRTALRTAAHSMGAAALAGALDGAALYHEDGLLIAHWGERVDALARLWRTHGAKACAALSGHFAFALLDERRGEALLAVDRCATRPLFYQLVGRTLVFASSADALVQHPGAGRELDPQALYNYLHLQALPGAIYKGQRRLAPGEFVHLHGGRLERGRYWRLRFTEHHAEGLPELKRELAETMRAAVDASLGQQPVGVMLGGGPGSAALAALLRDVGGAPVRTYAVGAAAPGGDTLAAARPVAHQLGTEHHEVRLDASDAADAIPKLAEAFDQPCGDPAALPAFYCAQLARLDGVQRLLCGHGEAELFGGHAHYAHQLRLARYERLPSALRQLVLEPLLFRLAGGVRRGPLAAARARVEQSMLPLPARLQHASLLYGYGAGQVFEADFLGLVDPSAPQVGLEQAWWLVQGKDQVNRMIALDLQYALVDARLPAMAKACEMAGMACAFPYLDDAVVAFTARLAPRHKSGTAGALLRASLAGTLPARLAARRRAGFALPFGQWLQSDARLKGLAYDTLAALRKRRIVRGEFIDTLLARHLPEDPVRHARMVWMLMMLELWFGQRRGTGCVLSAPEAQAAPGGP